MSNINCKSIEGLERIECVMPMYRSVGEMAMTCTLAQRDVVTLKNEVRIEHGGQEGYKTVQLINIPKSEIERVITFLKAFI